ncbi:hypothetical protein QBC45DRAFT_109044 [Copromyces sp. CBS 386.78]|nr:hypothetical protein QBC45DRAFT_109044 [Copromyces sp. CBS 386.78]
MPDSPQRASRWQVTNKFDLHHHEPTELVPEPYNEELPNLKASPYPERERCSRTLTNSLCMSSYDGNLFGIRMRYCRLNLCTTARVVMAEPSTIQRLGPSYLQYRFHFRRFSFTASQFRASNGPTSHDPSPTVNDDLEGEGSKNDIPAGVKQSWVYTKTQSSQTNGTAPILRRHVEGSKWAREEGSVNRDSRMLVKLESFQKQPTAG